MADQELDALRPVLALIPSSEVISATYLDSELIRFTTIAQASDANRDALKAAGLDLAEIDNLKTGIPALRSAETLWQLSFDANSAHVQWATQADQAFELRKELRRDLKHAFRKKPELLKVVAGMNQGNTNSGMLLELKELAELGANHADLLAAITFDTTKLDTATQIASNLPAIYAEHHYNRGGDESARDLRDRAFTFCSKAADEICVNGKYAFRKNAAMLEKFKGAWHTKPKPPKSGPDAPPNAS